MYIFWIIFGNDNDYSDFPEVRRIKIDRAGMNVDPESLNVDLKSLNVDPESLNVDPESLNVDPGAIVVDRDVIAFCTFFASFSTRKVRNFTEDTSLNYLISNE